MYQIKEIFYTLQGEGANAGRPAIFCRFAGCNLWSGQEIDRATAQCQFCDTDFVGTDGPGGGKYKHAEELVEACIAASGAEVTPSLVVLTGGEPMLQVNHKLIASLHDEGFEVAIETNGTNTVVDGVDWICVSPKAGTTLVQTRGDELKLVFPQGEAMPERFAALDFRHHLLQPMDGPDREANTQAAVAYCLAHPRWGLSLQTHKFLAIP